MRRLRRRVLRTGILRSAQNDGKVGRRMLIPFSAPPISLCASHLAFEARSSRLSMGITRRSPPMPGWDFRFGGTHRPSMPIRVTLALGYNAVLDGT